MGAKKSKEQSDIKTFDATPDEVNLAEVNSYKVENRETGDEGILVIRFPNLVLKDFSGGEVSVWPIKTLRGYGQAENVFSFETGRKCPTNPNSIFYFIVEGTKDVYADLNRVVAEYNHGVAGDRYDHIKPVPPLPQDEQDNGEYAALATKAPEQTQYAALNRNSRGQQSGAYSTTSITNNQSSNNTQSHYATAHHTKNNQRVVSESAYEAPSQSGLDSEGFGFGD
eukprot:m.78331 g.78331  ORF g.78331 m.78331 type:complete len:225 (-) comp12666_c0_seq3:921-1595(-)